MERVGTSRFQTTEQAEDARRQQQLRQWKTKQLIEASQCPTRMTWLYNTLTRYGNLHEFSPAAKEWVKAKVATEDIASRQEDPLVTDPWWEESLTAQQRSFFHQYTLPASCIAPGAPTNGSRRTIAEGAQYDVTAYRATLYEVLQSPLGISDLSDSLENEAFSHYWDFLAAVAQWRLNLLAMPKESDAPEAELQRARQIVATFLTKPGPGSVLSEINPTSVAQATTVTGIKKAKAHVIQSLFDLCVRDLEATLMQAWDEFRQQEANYLDLSALVDPNKPAPIQTNSNLLLQISGSETCSQAGIPPLTTWWPDAAPAWINTAGYQSIKLTLHVCKGPLVQKFGTNLYVVFGSGSRILKTSQAAPLPNAPALVAGEFNISCTLPITNTTPYVWIMLGAQGRCIGVAPLTLEKIHNAPQDGPIALYLRNETKPGSLTDAMQEKTTVGPQQLIASPQSVSGHDEVIISYTLSTDPCPDSSMDGFKSIYADDTAKAGLGDFIRGKVSKKKKRFTDDNFNLDLTYITPTVIAMGFPSEGAEGVYRNPLKQVQQFFLLRHPHSYRIYNLCSERAYDTGKFEGRCEHFPFDDHNPPPFNMIRSFCESVRQFLGESPQNVVSIHCKAGKGRTGTMIAAYLIYAAGLTAPQALHQFGMIRTSNGQGVTIASQMQYVHYFDHYCALRRCGKGGPGRTTLFLEEMTLLNLGQKFSSSDIQWTISLPNRTYDEEDHQVVETAKPVYIHPPNKGTRLENNNSIRWDLQDKLVELHEDVRFEFVLRSGMGGKEKLFHCWLNTRFVKLELSHGRPIARIFKPYLDKANKDTRHKKFDADIQLELVFSPVETAAQKRLELLSVPNRPELTTPLSADLTVVE